MFYNYWGFLILTWREIKRFLKVYFQTVLAPLVNNLLFLGIFGATLNSRKIGVEGIDYLSYLVPGLCAFGAMMSAFQNPSSSLIIQKYQNLIQDLNSYPMTTFEKVSAYLLSGTSRGFIVGMMTYVASLPFIESYAKHPFLFVVFIILVSLIFAGFGVIGGLTIKTFDGIAFLATFILTPLTYFGGLFFEISKLPWMLSKFSYFNPIVPLIDIVRYSFVDISFMSLLYDFVAVATLLIFSISIAYILVRKGVGLKE